MESSVSHHAYAVLPVAVIFAYLDPGSGSMIVQLIVGGVAAAGVAAKLYWNRLLRLLRIKKSEPAETGDAQAAPAEPDSAQR
jgi:hypothetical protein